MHRLNLLDTLTIAFISCILLLVVLFFPHFPHGWQLLFGHVLLLLLAFFISKARSRWKDIKIVRAICDFSPIFFILALYEMLGWITPYVRSDVDSLLINIDLALFGVNPTVWMERLLFPWGTDIFALAYASYYFIPLVLVLMLYKRGHEEEYSVTITTLLLGYYLCFIGYITMPAIGPRFTLESLQAVPLHGGIIFNSMVHILNALEGNQRDCFPSGHTQTVLISLWFAFKFKRPLFLVYLPITIALIFSTVYLRYHYVIDVLAGIVLAGITILLGESLWAWFRKRPSRDRD